MGARVARSRSEVGMREAERGAVQREVAGISVVAINGVARGEGRRVRAISVKERGGVETALEIARAKVMARVVGKK